MTRSSRSATATTSATSSTSPPWHEELALPTAELPHLIVAFKKAVEPLTTHALRGSGVQSVALRLGTIWGPLVDPESPFFHVPPYISAVLRGDEPPTLHAGRRWRLLLRARRRVRDRPPDDRGDPAAPHVQDTAFAPRFDVATAVADYVAWRADNRR